MDTPASTDVFKFLAVRPAQLATSQETARTIIRDRRASTEEGARGLAVLARRLSDRAAATELWEAVDLAPLAGLADRLPDLERAVDNADGEPVPGNADLLRSVGLPTHVDERLLDHAWDALYTAHATGNQAGRLLAVPMAALRVLHFTGIDRTGDVPDASADELRSWLHATVALPPQFVDAAVRPVRNRRGAGTPSEQEVELEAGRVARVRELAADLDVTQSLLERLTSVRAVQPVARQTEFDGASFAFSTVPTLRDAVSSGTDADERRVLAGLNIDDGTEVPAAAQVLQAHMRLLTDRAAEITTDPSFVEALAGGAAASLVAAKPATSAPDVDVSGLIVPLGIGDLKVVKQTLVSYVAGEVAHIENVLEGESKERTHRTLDRTETTIFALDEETKDTERDTQSTDRFELKSEAEKTIKTDLSVKAGVTVTASYGPVVATATGDFAYANSKQESQKGSSNFARDVVDRSVSKVQTRTRNERTTKTLNEVEEINVHGLDNGSPSDGNVTGVYRWVDKKYRAQVYNYGVRMMLDFVIPEPAAWYRATRAPDGPDIDQAPPPPFVHDPIGFGKVGNRPPLRAEHITEYTYQKYAARYNATVSPPPPLFDYVGAAIAPKDSALVGEAKSFAFAFTDLVIPAGYVMSSYSISGSAVWINYPQFAVQVRGDVWRVLADPSGNGQPLKDTKIGDPDDVNKYVRGQVPVSVAGYDILAFALGIQAVCLRTPESLATWQLQTFTAIQTAYRAMQTEYDQKVTQAEAAAAGIPIIGQNPGANRVIEQTELKKLCITMMTGQHYGQFGSMTEPPNVAAKPPEVDVLEALSQGPIFQFFEQAFEWEQMTYLFYPYFWGRKTNWRAVAGITDTDPLFQQFLTAGAARVQVPVPVQYIDAVNYLLQNPNKETDLAKKVWGGGEHPIIGSELYESLAEELRDRTDDLEGAVPEGSSWIITLPTTLVWLQPDGTLPVFE